MNRKIKNPSRLIGIILLLIAFCILAMTAYHFFNTETESNHTPRKAVLENTKANAKTEESINLLNYDFEIYQMPESAYDILGFSADRLSKEIKDWTYLNGYSQAHSATFYTSMTIDFNKKSYVMQCVLDDPDHTVITMDYLMAQDKLTFHL